MKILTAQLLPDISSFPPAPVSAVFFLHSLDTDTSKLLVCALEASAIFHNSRITVWLSLQDCSHWNFMRREDQAGQLFLKVLLWVNN